MERNVNVKGTALQIKAGVGGENKNDREERDVTRNTGRRASQSKWDVLSFLCTQEGYKVVCGRRRLLEDELKVSEKMPPRTSAFSSYS